MSKKILVEDSVYERQAQIYGALSHKVRLQIVDLLQEADMTCTEINDHLQIPKANLTQHLNVLKRAHIVKAEREGLFQRLSLNFKEIHQACHLVRKMLLEESIQQNKINQNLNKQLKRSL